MLLIFLLCSLASTVAACPSKEETLQALIKRIRATVNDDSVRLAFRREYTKKALKFIADHGNNPKNFTNFHASHPAGSLNKKKPNFRIYWLASVTVAEFFDCYASNSNGSDVVQNIFDVGFTDEYRRSDENGKKRLIWWAFGHYGMVYDEMYERGTDPRLQLPKVKKDIVEALRLDCQFHTKRGLQDAIVSLLEQAKDWPIPCNETRRAEYLARQIELATQEEARKSDSKIKDLMREYFEKNFEVDEVPPFDPDFFITETEEIYMFFACNGMAQRGHLVAEELVNLGFSKEYLKANEQAKRLMIWDKVFRARSFSLRNATRKELVVYN